MLKTAFAAYLYYGIIIIYFIFFLENHDTLPYKSLESCVSIKKRNKYFFQQGHIKLIKSDSEDIYNTKDFYLKQMLFFWTFWSKNI